MGALLGIYTTLDKDFACVGIDACHFATAASALQVMLHMRLQSLSK